MPRTFAIDVTPCRVWGTDLAKVDRDLLDRIDAEYFGYLANMLAAQPDEDEASPSRIALALRTAYAQDAETLLALLFAALQAPDCVTGWLDRYRTVDLQRLVNKVHERQPILSQVRLESPTWQHIADALLINLVLDDHEEEVRIRRAFGEFWRRLAAEFADDATREEYNHIKHGLRVASTGFSLAMGIEERVGVPAPPERMRSLGGSQFGSSYFSLVQIEGKRRQWQIVRHSRNWRLESLAYGLHLISFSMRNIISALQIMQGADPSGVRFVWPSDAEAWTKAWESVDGPAFFSSRDIIDDSAIPQMTDDEGRAVYESVRDAPAPDQPSD